MINNITYSFFLLSLQIKFNPSNEKLITVIPKSGEEENVVKTEVSEDMMTVMCISASLVVS